MSDKDFINSILVDENVDYDTASFLFYLLYVLYVLYVLPVLPVFYVILCNTCIKNF